jgi:hypothetical protein
MESGGVVLTKNHDGIFGCIGDIFGSIVVMISNGNFWAVLVLHSESDMKKQENYAEKCLYCLERWSGQMIMKEEF